MKLTNVHIQDFRLLKNTSVDFESDLSLVIGKNNTGKTSLLTVLDKFLNSSGFSYNDINTEEKSRLEADVSQEISAEEFIDYGICARLEFEYDVNEDDISSVANLIMDLDENIHHIVLVLEFKMDFDSFTLLKTDFDKFSKGGVEEGVNYFLEKNYKKYFIINKNVVERGNEENNKKQVDDKDIKKLIALKVVEAKRDVANSERESSNLLSKLSAKYYKARNPLGNSDITDISDLGKKLIEADKSISESYKSLFGNVIDSITRFSDVSASLQILSNLTEVNLFESNTVVRYNQDGHNLPETHSGLGYMNLFAIIFDIHIKLDEFKKISDNNAKPSLINLLFIEEPEAHTHPQMQYVFIKNIKRMLLEGSGENLNLQTIITTHSSHIVSQSNFDDIKYFHRQSDSLVVAKNLTKMKELYGAGSEAFSFLKNYLTLNNSELLFADKAIFIEGSTERILLPAIMEKIDMSNGEDEHYIPLLSQNISIVEVGNYSHIFGIFLDFLDIKALVVTDLDSINNEGKTCPVAEGVRTSNGSLKSYFRNIAFADLKSLTTKQKSIKKESVDGDYEASNKGNLYIAYQTENDSYQARSFEDAFIAVNYQFIRDHKDDFVSLKNRGKIDKNPPDYYKLANGCIDKKSVFATDILFYSNDQFSNWIVPQYIEEGLLWLGHQ